MGVPAEIAQGDSWRPVPSPGLFLKLFVRLLRSYMQAGQRELAVLNPCQDLNREDRKNEEDR